MDAPIRKPQPALSPWAYSEAVRMLTKLCHDRVVSAGERVYLRDGRTIDFEDHIAGMNCLLHNSLFYQQSGGRDADMQQHTAVSGSLARVFVSICDVSEELGLDLGGAVVDLLALMANADERA